MFFVISIIILVFVLLWWGVGWFEHSNLYYPTKELVGTPFDLGLTYSEVSLTTQDELSLSAWDIPVPSQSTAPLAHQNLTLLLCHGNGGNISHRLDRIDRLHKMGFNIFIFDYRGFGSSQGKPYEHGLYEDAETAIRYLLEEKKIPLDHIVLYGESLGGAIATEMAFRRHVRALILEDTFTSVINMSKHLFPWLPAQYLARNRYESINKIPHIKSPILIFHSKDDEVVPFFMGKQLYEAAPKGTHFVELSGPHADAYALCYGDYERAILKHFSS